jgi:hypothetical protein
MSFSTSTLQIAASIGLVAMVLSAILKRNTKLDNVLPDILVTIQLANPVAFVQRRIKAWSFLLDGPRMIREGYEKVRNSMARDGGT